MIRTFFIYILILYSHVIMSSEVINIEDHKHSNITKHTSFYTDKTKMMPPHQIDNIINDKLIKANNINRKQSLDNHWFKITLKNNINLVAERYLSIESVFPGNYISYEKVNNVWIRTELFGTSLKTTNKTTNSTRATKRLIFEPGEEKQILLLRDSHHLLSVKIKLESLMHFYQYETKKKAIFLLFLGVVLVIFIFIFNILLYIYRKSNTTLVFIIFMVNITFFLSILNGFIDLFNFGISPSFKHHGPFFPG